MTPALETPPAVEVRGLRKVFGNGPAAVLANDGVDLTVRAGTIHAIVGENGAGKSTALKCVFGMLKPDGGSIRVVGTMGMVHQHFMLAGPCTVLENILLGSEGKGMLGILPLEGAAIRIRELGEKYSMPVDPWARIEDLPVGIQQRVEILKLLYNDCRILILDEPTAVLTPQEIEVLFANLRRLRDEGRTILIITHKLKEVLALSDEVTVLRSGRTVGTQPTREATAEGLAEWMVGRKVVLGVEAGSPPRIPRSGEPRLRVATERLSLEVWPGEIVGIAGVEGNGQSELLRSLLEPSGRSIRILGHEVGRWPASRIRGLKVAFFPEDRHRDGLLLDESVERNLLLGHQRNPRFVGRGGLIREQVLSESLRRAWREYGLTPDRPAIPARSLSGGNQQKLVIAREFEHEPDLVVAAHPTRGVDVGAIEWIHRKLLAARDGGAGVLLVSSELDEILTLSDRILVMYEGRISGRFDRGQADAQAIGRAMGGEIR